MKSKGFTLIEMLVVVAIVGMMLAVSFPVSYDMYRKYKASQKAEEVLVWVSAIRMNSFLYNKENVLDVVQRQLTLNDVKTAEAKAVTATMEKPIRFFRNGTTTGGQIKIQVEDVVFFLNVEAPFGNIYLKRSG
jgi:prepilin-type N-terminal cleavage/methylation domain-containing protein